LENLGGMVRESVLLEREREIAALSEVVDAALARNGLAVLLEGSAGAGKSALVNHACRLAGARGLHVVPARGAQLELGFPFGVARQIVGPLAADLPELLTGPGRRISRLLDDEELEPGETRMTAWSLVRFILRAAEVRPIFMCVDDGHWADGLSLELLAVLARDLPDAGIGLVVAARAAEPGAPLALRELVASPGVRRLVVRELSDEAVTRLVRSRLPAASLEFCAACRTAGGGNPFLTHSMIDSLEGEAVMADEEAAKKIALLAPPTVVAATAARVGQLGPAARSLAHAAAILERDVRLDVAAALAGLEMPVAAPAADDLRGARIIEGGSEISFVHPLLRNALYEDIPPGRRALLHGHAARLLHGYRYPAERVAAHVLLTVPASDPFAVGVLRAAAARASARGAPEVAVELLQRALDEPPSDADRHDVRVELAMARYRARADPGVVLGDLLEAFDSAPDPRMRTRAASLIAHVGIEAGQATRVAQALHAALADLPADEIEQRRLLEVQLLEAAVNDAGLLSANAGLVDQLAGTLDGGTEPNRRLLRVVACAVAVRGGDAATVHALLERAGGLDELEPRDAFRSASTLRWIDRYEQADALATRLIMRARTDGDLPLLQNALALRSSVSAACGDLSSAQADIAESIELDDPLTAGVLQAHLAHVLALSGRPQEALARAEVARVDRLPETMWVRVEAEWALAGVDICVGNYERAARALRSVEQRWRQYGVIGGLAMSWRSDLARALAGRGNYSEARALADEEAVLASRLPSTHAEGNARLAWALCAPSPDPDELRTAVSLLRDGPRRLALARALLEFGAALRRRREREACREPLSEALDLATRCGARALAERARTELRASGARPRRELRSGRDALTPSELRVARLAAEGRSNREIAQELFVTRKTVETHMSQILQKLDIKSRTAIATALEAEL
jgi:DNA-binding CsgD family transcriptional regulator